MKSDIFNGKIKKEYFSYILISTIFITLLCVACGGIFIYAAFTSASSILFYVLGAFVVAIGPLYFFLSLFVIRSYPKYEKLRSFLLNSDIYFVDSTSNEYRESRIRSWSARRARAAFTLVTISAEADKIMRKKSRAKYNMYVILSLVVLGMDTTTIVLAAIFEPSGGLFVFLLICFLLLCLGFVVWFFKKALMTAAMAPYEDVKWKFDLSFSLQDIAVRKNNKKHKFWYEVSQIDKIEEILDTCGENVELKLETKGKKKVSFSIVDMNDNILVFKGYFI